MHDVHWGGMLVSNVHVLVRKSGTSFNWVGPGVHTRITASLLQMLQWQAKENKVQDQMGECCGVVLHLLRCRLPLFLTVAPSYIELDNLGGDVLHFGKTWIKRADKSKFPNSAKNNYPRETRHYKELIFDEEALYRL